MMDNTYIIFLVLGIATGMLIAWFNHQNKKL